MMASVATTEDYKIALFSEISYPDGHAIANLTNVYWTIYADKAVQEPRLQYLYVKRALIDAILQNSWDNVDWKEADVDQSDGDLVKNLQQMRANVNDDIKASETRLRGNRAPVVVGLVRTAPIQPDNVCQADPNSRVFRGDPLRRY